MLHSSQQRRKEQTAAINEPEVLHNLIVKLSGSGLQTAEEAKQAILGARTQE